MATYLGIDDDEATALLASVGTQIGQDEEAVTQALAEGEREARAIVELAPPAEGAQDEGMGTWHVNAATEAHTVLDGSGVMEFWTGDRAVSVLVEGGDVVVNRGAEHRYRPLVPQRWVIRHSGGPDADLGASDTGREPGPWPDVTA
jgi:mannose-6-phosphate isomerase-like protein (cupin superfamily)